MSMKSLIEIEGISVRLVGVFNITKIWIGQLLTSAIYHQFGHIVKRKKDSQPCDCISILLFIPTVLQ